MKLAVVNKKITARVSESYVPPNGVTVIDEPEGFDFDKAGEYIYDSDQLTLVVPDRVTMRQARLALLAAGKYSNITGIINTLPVNQREAAAIEWEYALFISRKSALVSLLGTSLGFNSSQLDALFIAAASIPD